MTLAELIHKRIHLSSPSKEKQQNRVQQTQLNEKETNQNKFQRIQTSLLNIFPNFRPAENERKLSVTIQRTNSSIIKSSAIRRTNSKKTVTFASVFDLVNNNENLEHFGDSNFGFLEEYEKNLELNMKNRNEETQNNSQSTTDIESTPSVDPKVHQENIDNTDTVSDLLTRQTFVRRQSSRVRRNSKKANNKRDQINRSTSVPEISFSVRTNSPNNNQRSKLNHIRKWLKTSSFNRFLHSFQNQTQNNSTGLIKINNFLSIHSKTRPKSTEIIY